MKITHVAFRLFAVLSLFSTQVVYPQASTVSYLTVTPQNNLNEGGELTLQGASSYNSILFDNYEGNARIFGLAPGKIFEVLGAAKFDNLRLGTATDYGFTIQSSASQNHLLLRRSAGESVGGKVLFMELFQDESATPSVPVVFPSIRFHHAMRFWHRLEVRPEGFYFKEGWLESDNPSSIYSATAHLQATGAQLVISQSNDPENGWSLWGGTNLHFQRKNGADILFLSATGNVGIGTTNPTHKLAVNGTIKAKEVIVETTGWSDYVFAADYALAPLTEVEAHIKEHKHLPGIPSASQVAEHGVSVGDMQVRLLAKIEELTLHQIAQEKRSELQAREIAALKAQNATLLQMLNRAPSASATY